MSIARAAAGISREVCMSIHSFIYKDASEASEACAVKVAELLQQAVAAKPSAAFAVSGGTTPKLLFRELAKIRLEWDKVHLFWVDERCVPPTDAQSNYKLAKENFIDPAGFPAAHVHRIQAELEPERAARLYADEIRSFFSLGRAEFPSFDIIH